ncbi:MAG TPA: hypothetical protein VNI83_08125, partial [Vicinamibacterales bacterium]|nr:hypothetical protein [Vicinamibacterales bacterium]
GSRVDASPERILMEAVARERMWAYQPDKVLRWDVEALSSGIKGIADGRWRSTFWQKNGRSTFSQVWRQFDPRGQIARATWRREDGSVLVFRPDGRDVVEILPSAAEARAALPGLEPKLRNALTAYLDRQESLRTLDFHSRRLAEWLNQPALRTPGAVATLRGGVVAEWGETYHITVVNARPRGSPSILRAVHEYDVEKASYRLLRLKSTVTYADGTTGLHESRWMGYREATDAEFEAHVPLELLRIGAPVVHVTPRELAMRHLRDLSRALTSPN